MRVFVSWSGQASLRLATALKEWLPSVLQTVQPFVSSEDIQKGSRWFNEIGTQLEQTTFGILCVTPDNASAPWMLFEAGALSKTVGQARVCPLLAGLRKNDLHGPLANFNAATVDRDEVFRLVKSINANASHRMDDRVLESTFASCWPPFAEAIEPVLRQLDNAGQPTECPVRSRNALPKMAQWPPALAAKDLLMIGLNLNLVLRQRPFFEKTLAGGARLRLVIVDPRNALLLEVISRGIVEHSHFKADFEPALRSVRELRDLLPQDETYRLELRTIDYVPTLSFQVLDGTTAMGTILVELAPNRIEVLDRPHFLLRADNPAHTEWYGRFLQNCTRTHDEARPWVWE